MSKILIIDDEAQIRSLLARMMELEGYEVCQAGDCKSALKQLELHSPDVALCDVFLPDGNGVDLVLAIKKTAPNVEVILLTAHGNIPDGVQAIKNGAFDYITKGDDNNKIIPLISRAVEKARMNVRLEKLEKKGLFEEANNGTIFLDEIGEMAFELQAKLLRILETGEYIKIGDTKPTRVDVRIIAATNRNLPEEIVAGRFREDLFYRLSVFEIHLPPLRERSGDIKILAEAFVRKFSEKLSYSVTKMSPEFLVALSQQCWKGNIRELRNVIERSLIVCDGECLDVCDLPLEIQNSHYERSDEAAAPGSFELAAMERRHIARVLEYTKGNKTETARLLKIGLTTLYRKIEEYKL